jgi:predicted MPP superfamily phosphohydrolase
VRLISAILFGLLFTGGMHTYVWWRLVRPLSAKLRRVLTGIMAALYLAIPITTTSRMWAPSLSSTLGWVSLTWLAFVGLTVVTLLAVDIPRWIVLGARRALDRPVTPERRQFLARATGGAAVAISAASVARGMISARGTHEVVDVEVRLATLPRALDGFSIVQLSDLHAGMTIDRAFVERVVDIANGLSPDLLALTGDLVDGKVDDLREEVAPLAKLRAKHGVFAVTGNHEYYAGADAWIAELSRHGVRYLRNQRVTIADGFELAGVDDYSADGYRGHGEDLAAATAGRRADLPLVLLAHQPRQVRRAAKHGVDLQLSGHTHGGQIWPWHFIVKIQQGGLLAGRYEHEGTQLYVTRGCGYWGPPVRVLAPLEITRIILRSA